MKILIVSVLLSCIQAIKYNAHHSREIIKTNGEGTSLEKVEELIEQFGASVLSLKDTDSMTRVNELSLLRQVIFEKIEHLDFSEEEHWSLALEKKEDCRTQLMVYADMLARATQLILTKEQQRIQQRDREVSHEVDPYIEKQNREIDRT
eukprot:Platyproteum_vivax@DN4319_c0_g1_i1.p1